MDNILRITKLTLEKLGANHTDDFISDFYKINRPSYQSITKLLSEYNVASMIVEISLDQLDEVEYPIIVTINERLYICEKYENKKVHLISPSGKKIIYNKEEFGKKWQGVAILLDASNLVNEPFFQENQAKQTRRRLMDITSIISVSGILCFVLFNLYKIDPIIFSLLLINMVGIILSFHLVKLSNGIKTRLSESVCNFSKGTKCQKLLASKVSSVKGISLADIGVIYFLFISLVLVMAPFRVSYISILFGISGLASLFSIFSIGYQIKVKAWCPLCLLVVLALLSDYAILIFSNIDLISINVIEALVKASPN